MNTSLNSIHFDDLLPGKNFSVRVISFNKYGSSPPSLNVTFETLREDGKFETITYINSKQLKTANKSFFLFVV